MENMYQFLTKFLHFKTKMDHLDVPIISVAASVGVLLLTAIYFWVKNRGILPGPKGVPYLGLFPYLTDENIHLKLDEYKKIYGDIFSFTYTGRLYINLGSVKAMREVQVSKSDCFADRFKDTHILVNMLNNGLTFVNGERWRVLRKFFIQNFKDRGLNTLRDNMAGPVYDSLNDTMDELKILGDKPVNIVELLGKRCAVTMRRLLFGEDGITDEEIGQMTVAFAGILEGNTGISLLLIGPLARLLFRLKSGYRRNFQHHNFMSKLTLNCCKRIESSMKNESESSTCIIEDFYKERNKRRQSNDSTWKYFTDEALVESVLQFTGDGILSVAGFIAGLLSGILEHPDEQEKVYTEIMEVVGPNRQPVVEDRANMPYTNAFMSEYLRFSNFMNFFPSLECTKETTVRGYRIPKGSITLLNFYSCHHDPETFDNPEMFNPSRYVPSSGKPKAESPVVFGMGKRSCSGEQFVMMQAFLFLTTIIKNFKIVSSNAPNNSSVDFLVAGQLELTLAPRVEN